MLLYYAIFVVVLVIAYQQGQFWPTNSIVTTKIQDTALVQTAQEGATLYAACSAASVSAGNYTAGSLNAGLPISTPLGNQWGCLKTAGGVYGTLITSVTFISPPTSAPGLGPQDISNSLVQQNLVYKIVEDMLNMVQFNPNTVVGTIPAGSLNMEMLAPSGQSIPLLAASFPYATPAIVGNLYATTPTNNQTAPGP